MKTGIYTPRFMLLSMSSMFFFMSFYMIIPELPAYLEAMGGGELKGLIVTLFAFSAGLSRPFSGKLSDVVGRKPVMFFGGIICVMLGFLYPAVSTIYGFLFLRFIHGFSAGFNPTGTVAYLADIVPPDKRGAAMGIFGMVNSIGTSIGPAIGGAVANSFGVDFMFFCSAAAGLISLIVLFTVKESLPETRRFGKDDMKITRADVFDKRVQLPAVIMILTVFSFGAVHTLIPDFSVNLGIKNKGLFFTVLTVSSVVIRLLTNRMSDKYGRLKMAIVGSALLTIAMILVANANGRPGFILAAVVFGLALGINSPTLFAWAIDLSNGKNLGRGTATLFISMEFGMMLGAFIPMLFYANIPENLSVAFYICALVAFFSLLTLVVQQIRITRKQ